MKLHNSAFAASLSLLLITWGGQAGAADRYVAKNGKDSNDGSIGAPWLTLGKLNQAVKAGDTVYIREGVYKENLQPQVSGSATARITIKSFPGEKATITGSANNQPAVTISVDYVTIENLNIKLVDPVGDWSTNLPDVSISGATGTQVLGCRIVNSKDAISEKNAGVRELGIVIGKSKDTLLEKNFIKGLSFIAIKVATGSLRTVIRNNVTLANVGEGVRVDSSQQAIAGTLIEGNIFGESLTGDGVQTNPDFGLPAAEWAVSTDNRGIIIRNNVLFNNAENAVDLKGAADVVVENNIIYGNTGNNDGFLGDNKNDRLAGGGAITHGSGTETKDVIIRFNVIYDNNNGMVLENGWKVYNNTILDNRRDYTGPNSTYDIVKDGGFGAIKTRNATVTRAAIVNNIIGQQISGAQLVTELRILESTEVDLRANMYVKDSTTTPKFVIQSSPGVYDTLNFADWKARLAGMPNVTGKEKGSFEAAPVLVKGTDPEGIHVNYDFKIANQNSAVVDAGAYLTTTVAAGSGTKVKVGDAHYFFDGYGVTSGDTIKIGNNAPVVISAINYDTNEITIKKSLTWNAGDGVSPPFSGSKPDIGAIEYGDSEKFPMRPAFPPGALGVSNQ